MKKLIGPFAKVFGAIFAVGVFVIVISLSYSALGRIFPGRLFDQSAGMLLFDAAAIVWFLTFISNSKSVSQYVASGLGFLLGVLGSLGLIGIEVGISSGMLNAADMVKPLTYVFILAAIGHLIITYAFHGSAPEISAQISMGFEQARAQEEGMRQAERAMSQDMTNLGHVLSARILEDLYRNMNMPQQVINTRALPTDDSLHVPSNGYPLSTEEKPPSFFGNTKGWFQRKFRGLDQGPQINEQAIPQEELAKEKIAENLSKSSDHLMAWKDLADGGRFRIFCKICKEEGKPWFMDQPCEHVLSATNPEQVSLETAMRMLMSLYAEEEPVG